MGSFAIPLVVFTAFWAIVGAGGPWLVPKGPNRGIIQVMLVLTAVCCYMFWLMAFLHQLNPLLGPELEVATLIWLNNTWGHSEIYQENTETGESFGTEAEEVEFVCVCDVTKEKYNLISELNKAQTFIIHVWSTMKNAADHKLKACLQKFGKTYTPPGTVVLISSDTNFAPDMNYLRYRCGFEVVLVHGNCVTDELLITAHWTCNIRNISEDVPAKTIPVCPAQHTCQLKVQNLPDYMKYNSVKKRLEQLSSNCGGRVVSLNLVTRSAILKFDDQNATLRANKRMNDENVFGKRITVCTVPNSLSTQRRYLKYLPPPVIEEDPRESSSPTTTLPFSTVGGVKCENVNMERSVRMQQNQRGKEGENRKGVTTAKETKHVEYRLCKKGPSTKRVQYVKCRVCKKGPSSLNYLTLLVNLIDM